MQHAYVLRCDNVNQHTRLQVPYFNKIRFKCKEIWMRKSKSLGPTFPINQPVRSSAPAVSVNEEGKFRIMEEKLAIEALDGDWNNVFTSDKIQ